jgi:RNA processing factor Prp31
MALPSEFDISGATYYAVAPAGYSYSEAQTAQYSTRKYETMAAAAAALDDVEATTPIVVNVIGEWSADDTTGADFSLTTTAANYLLVRTIGEARSTYRIAIHNEWQLALALTTDYCRVDGLNVRNSASGFYAWAAQLGAG